MDRKAGESTQGGRAFGRVRRGYRDAPDLSAGPTFEELRNRFDSSAAAGREVAANPSTHGSATRQSVSGKIFKKCKSATFQIDGATYTIAGACGADDSRAQPSTRFGRAFASCRPERLPYAPVRSTSATNRRTNENVYGPRIVYEGRLLHFKK
ncbi:unnamed protein product, partial [Iphiclides podalirius]